VVQEDSFQSLVFISFCHLLCRSSTTHVIGLLVSKGICTRRLRYGVIRCRSLIWKQKCLCLLKVASVSDWRRGPGRLFHSLGLAAAKLWSPSFVLVHGTTSVGTLAERSRLPLLTSLANLHLSCKYVGARPGEIWYINTASLKSIRRLTGNQWSCLRTGVMCSHLPVRVSSYCRVGLQSFFYGRNGGQSE